MNLIHIFMHVFSCLLALSFQRATGVRAIDEGDGGLDLIISVAKGAHIVPHEEQVLELSQQELTLSDFQVAKSQGSALPMLLILLGILAVIVCLVFACMMRDSTAADKSELPLSSPQRRDAPPAHQLLSMQRAVAPIQRAVSQPTPTGSPMVRSNLPDRSGPMGSNSSVRPPSMRSTSGAGADVEQGASQHAQPAPKTSISSTALIVRSSDGVILQSDYKVSPYPEQNIVNFKSLKGANAVVRARIDELGGQKRVMVESASGIPLALIDTTYAVHPQNREAAPRDSRRANIHRVAGNSFSVLGSPCACVLSLSPQTFVVLSKMNGEGPQDNSGVLAQMGQALTRGFASHQDVLLTVQCDGQGYVTEMRDGSGNIVVRQENTGNLRGGDRSNMWVSQGADITLIVCIVLAVGKLA